MRSWSPSIVPPWSPSDLEEMLCDALRVLEEIGVECTHEETRHRLDDWGGVFFTGQAMELTTTF